MKPVEKKSSSPASKPFDPTVVKSQVNDAALVQRRREQIVEAAVDLFSTKGFHRTTIQEVARKAGVSTGLIYQYAEKKEDILLLSLLSVMRKFRHELESTDEEDDEPLVQLYAALEAYCRVVDRDRNATSLAYRTTMSLPADHRNYIKQAELETNELIAMRIRACVRAGLFREVDPMLAIDLFVMHAHTWSLKYWRLRKRFSISEYVDAGFDLFVHALATRAGMTRYKQFLVKRAEAGVPRSDAVLS